MPDLQHAAEPEAKQPVDWTAILFSYPTRLIVYAAIVLCACQFVLYMVQHHGIESIAHEYGPVEKSQIWLAMFASGCLFFASTRVRIGQTGLIICACMVGYAAARESDSWFERVFFDDAYKYMAGIPLAAIALFAFYRGRKRFFVEAPELLRTPAITIFTFAGIFICTVCQSLDAPELWASIGASWDAEVMKAAVEEFAEMFGYLLLAFAGTEAVTMSFCPSMAKSSLKRGSAADSRVEPEPRVSLGW